jgi:hypothetical protein
VILGAETVLFVLEDVRFHAVIRDLAILQYLFVLVQEDVLAQEHRLLAAEVDPVVGALAAVDARQLFVEPVVVLHFLLDFRPNARFVVVHLVLDVAAIDLVTG